MKDKDFEELWNSGTTARKYRQCHISDQELDKIIGKAIDRDKQTRQKHFTIRKRPYLYPAMAVACVAALMVALWQVRTNSVFIPNTPEALQPSASVLVAQTTDTNIPNTQDHRPATITDNEIKNKPTAEQNTMPTTATPQPDIIATAPIEQEHIPVLLAEAESKIHAEQHYADTAYMIADAEPIYNNLEMYCSTKCLSNEVSVAYFDVTGENFI